MDYSEIIFTNHALTKLKDRGVRKEDAFETIVHPDRRYEGKKKDTAESIRKFEGFEITTITKKNDKKELIVLSVWRDPPLPGTADVRQNANFIQYKKSGMLEKIWITIKQQLGF